MPGGKMLLVLVLCPRSTTTEVLPIVYEAAELEATLTLSNRASPLDGWVWMSKADDPPLVSSMLLSWTSRKPLNLVWSSEFANAVIELCATESGPPSSMQSLFPATAMIPPAPLNVVFQTKICWVFS
jgi:hypothetical protein